MPVDNPTDRAHEANSSGPFSVADDEKLRHMPEERENPGHQRRSVVDSLSITGLTEIEFEPPHFRGITRPADLS